MRGAIAVALLASAATVAQADVKKGKAAAEDPAPAPAGDGKDGYCEFVQGTAQSQADFFYAPTAIGSIGYVKEPNQNGNNEVVSGGRGVLGLSYNFIGIMQGNATKKRADADCKRHKALDRVQGETVFRALKAKQAVYDAAIPAADKILAKTKSDVEAHRTTAQEMVSTRLRVNELHDLESDTKRQIAALPAPEQGENLGGALTAYYNNDAEIEHQEGRLRRLQGISVDLRGGFDSYFDRTDSTPVFVLLEVGVNLGVFFQGSANERAAQGRRKMVREQHQVQLVDTTVNHLKDELAAESQRATETAALEQDLANQIATIERIGGDDNLRYRDTVWFDYVKVKAEHAYFEAHVASLKEVLGEVGEQ